MITRLRHGLSLILLSAICMLASAFTAFAANFDGDMETVGRTTISGWAADKDNPDKSVEVVLYLYTDGSAEAKELARVKADQYRNDLEKSLGSGNHSFSYSVNWDSISGKSYIIQAFAVSDGEQAMIGETAQYSKNSPYHAAEQSVVAKASAGPSNPTVEASAESEPVLPAAPVETGKRGASLGTFIATAYCSCGKCSSGTGLTYSETVPRAKHTLSADIDYYPIGTKIMIGDIVYTVEDIGSGVNGKRLDIYFDSHQEALNFGRQTIEAFAVE